MRANCIQNIFCVLLIAFAGCTFGNDSQGSTKNFCDSDDDCPNSSCDLQNKVCLAADALNFQIVLEVVIANAEQGLKTSVFSERFPLEDGKEKIMELGTLTNVFGTVRTHKDNTRILGDIVFTRKSSVRSLASNVVVQTLSKAAILENGHEVDFATTLLTGSYDVRIQPNIALAQELPPMAYTLELLGELEEPISFVYPEPQEWCVFAGTILDPAHEGMNGLRVKAVDRTTGQAVSSAAVTATVDNQPGVFAIQLPKDLDNYVLIITPDSNEMIYPEVTIDPNYLFPQAECEGNYELWVPGKQTSTAYHARVVTSEKEPVPVSNAVVIMTSMGTPADTGVEQVHRVSVLTDKDGNFQAQLLPGQYELIVRPESTAVPYGVFATTVDVSDSGLIDAPDDQLFVLPLRHQFRGRVKNAEAQPMQGAVVQAVAQQVRSNFEEWPEAAYNRSNQTQTDADGEFVLPLDVGRYDLVIQTRAESGFPWVVVPDVSIQKNQTPASEQAYTLVSPVPVTGRVVDALGHPVMGVEVTAHGVIMQGTSQRSLPVGSTVTDSDGAFTLLLAPLL